MLELAEQIFAHAREELPNECCGLIGGKDGVLTLYPGKSLSPSPVRFDMDPRWQFEVFQEMRKRDEELIAIYHSHPNGAARPSAEDIARASYPVIFLIASVPDGELRGYRIAQGKAEEVPLEAS